MSLVNFKAGCTGIFAMYPKLTFDIKKIVANAKRIEGLCADDLSFCLVAKILAGNLDVLKPVVERAGIKIIADASVSSLQLYKNLPCEKWLIREPMISQAEDACRYSDAIFVSEKDTVFALNAAAGKLNKTQKLILTYELGDLREGCTLCELRDLVGVCLKLKNVEIYGLASNLTCYGAILPTTQNMQELSDVAKKIESEFGIVFDVVSGANSSAYEMLERGDLARFTNNIRFGEAVWCGYDAATLAPIDGFDTDTVRLAAEIVEIKQKPSIPRGISNANAKGEIPHFVDRGVRTRALLAVGCQDINAHELRPLDAGAIILGESSDYLLVDITDCKRHGRDLKIGDTLEFNMRYMSVLKACMSKFVSKELR